MRQEKAMQRPISGIHLGTAIASDPLDQRAPSYIESETTRGRGSVAEPTLPKLPLETLNMLNWRHLTEAIFLINGKR
jgi:hypothetical protein